MTKRLGIFLIVLGVIAFIGFAASSIPAATAYRYFAPDSLRLMGIEGTIWNGRAALGSVDGLPLHDIQWQVNGASLLTGKIAGHAQAKLSEGFVDSGFNVRPSGRVQLDDLKVSTTLQAFAKKLPLQGMQGRISLAFSELQLVDGRPVAATGEVRLAGLAVPPMLAGSAAREAMLLGNYEAKFRNAENGQGIIIDFRDTGGPLQVSGTVNLNPEGRYEIKGLVAARPDAPETLAQGLQYIGAQPDAKGRRAFALSGVL